MMQRVIAEALARLPPLDPSRQEITACKICSSRAPIFDIVDFNKFCNERDFYRFGLAHVGVKYFRCDACGFIFTRFFDDWTNAEFARFVYNDDYIKVDPDYAGLRPQRDAEMMAQRLASQRDISLLDYGGGAGIFAETLKRSGLPNAATFDPFSSPTRPTHRFDLLTCFEVLEHAPDPGATMRDIRGLMKHDGCIVFGTVVQPPEIETLRGTWWYIAPRNGHVSIYSLESLAVLAQAEDLVFHAGPGLHAFAPRSPSAGARQILDSVGSPFTYVKLHAPPDAVGQTGRRAASDTRFWHPGEQASRPFRWTSKPEVEWRIDLGGTGRHRLKISLPYVMEVEPGLAAKCRFRIGERSVVPQQDGSTLHAVVDVDVVPDMTVTLVMPYLRRPSDLRPTPDQRPLGLAIPIDDASR